MDAIGSSRKIVWLFIFICTYFSLLLIFSIAIWSYDSFKRFAFISYVADTILTGFILLGTIDNLVSRIIRENFIYYWNILFLILSAVFIILSISFCRKNKKVSNISMNVATVLCIIVLCNQINTINA